MFSLPSSSLSYLRDHVTGHPSLKYFDSELGCRRKHSFDKRGRRLEERVLYGSFLPSDTVAGAYRG